MEGTGVRGRAGVGVDHIEREWKKREMNGLLSVHSRMKYT